ncbi:fimbrial protein [Klebsiella aerogenes]|uniref:fimbrial protein n=1 Tax=Klebsiella aerogenes TaxID=548 RepID=UPI00396781B6
MWVVNYFLMSILLLLSNNCLAANQIDSSHGWGRVNMQGSIIDTACSIAVDSREQTIDMDTTPLSEIIRNGHGQSKRFSIELVNCVIKRVGKEDWKQFSVTFDGNTDGDLFSINGDASGIALQIFDDYGNVVIPGKSLPALDIAPGKDKLDFKIRVVANKDTLKSGDYFSSIRFKIDYF